MTKKTTTFGERLMQARNTAMLSRSQLATASGIPAKAIEKFEYGTQDPTISRVKTLAQVLNVEVDYLMTGEGVTMPTIEPVVSDDVASNMLGGELEQITQKLSYLDELREDGFQKKWRTAPRLFEEVQKSMQKLSLDDVLDLGEARELFPVSEELLDQYQEMDGEEREAFIDNLIERVLDTAYFGLDLHTIRKSDLVDLAHCYDLDGDDTNFWGSKWSGQAAIVSALQYTMRHLALKGQSPDFMDEKEYKQREVA